MQNDYPKPKWWRLYAIVPFTLTLLVFDAQLALPELGHKLVEILIVMVTVGLIGLWVMANAAALEVGDAEERPAANPAGVRRRALARRRMSIPPPKAQTDSDALLTIRNN